MAGMSVRLDNRGKTIMRTIAVAIAVLSLVSVPVSAQTLDDLKRDGNGGPTENILTSRWDITSASGEKQQQLISWYVNTSSQASAISSGM